MEARERDGAVGGAASVPPAPGFGTSASPWSEVAAFYACWGEWVSRLSFGWADEYREQDAPSRYAQEGLVDPRLASS